MTTQKELQAQLQAAGILPTDTVVIHSSLKSMGQLEDGADGFIDACCDYLRDGLLLIPTHTWANVNRKNPLFDVRTTVPCIGALPTVAAFRKDATRSLHPTHSLAAFGKRRDSFVQGEGKTVFPMPPDSCWGRLYDEDAKILLVGVEHNKNTYIHAIEERAQVPNRFTEDAAPFVCIDKDGVAHNMPTKTHFTPGTYDVSANFVKFTDTLTRQGATHTAKIGQAETIVCNAKKMTDILLPLYAEAIAKNIDLCADERPLTELLGHE